MTAVLSFELTVLGVTLPWVCALCWSDMRSRRLPNLVTMGGVVAALILRWSCGGMSSLLDGFAGGAVAGAFLLLPFLMHGAGGGDVKMLFAAGTMVGWSRVIYLLWYMSLAGLVLAVVMVLFGWADGARLKHYARCLVDWRYDRKIGAAVLPPKESDRTRMPFSIAISVGLLMALMVKT